MVIIEGGKKICQKDYVLHVAKKRRYMEEKYAQKMKITLYVRNVIIGMGINVQYVERL